MSLFLALRCFHFSLFFVPTSSVTVSYYIYVNFILFTVIFPCLAEKPFSIFYFIYVHRTRPPGPIFV